MEARRGEAEEQEGEQLVGWRVPCAAASQRNPSASDGRSRGRELHEKLTGERSTKVLEAWAKQRARWEKVKARLTSASGARPKPFLCAD